MVDTIVAFFKEHIFNIGIIVAGALLLHNTAMVVVRKLITSTLRPERFKTKKELSKRRETLLSTVNAAVRVLVWIIAILLLLAEIGINIGPLLAGAGIAGIALGFGAQTIVRDFLAGFFILTENHYRVGDVVSLNQTVSGVVERVTLRQTVLRDLDGMVHHIPNGEITIATNMTMEFSGINLDISVDYATDLEKLEKIVNDVGKSIAEDEAWEKHIIEAPHFTRVDNFAESAIIIKITGKTAPMQQWAIAGELRKRLKMAFDKNNIDIPLPQRVITERPLKK